MSMTMTMSKRNYFLLAAALGLGSIAGGGSPAFGGDPVPRDRGGRRGGPGWSNRHVQRMAVKKRNQARHRAACRGKRRSRA